jgi:hypothetical protein
MLIHDKNFPGMLHFQSKKPKKLTRHLFTLPSKEFEKGECITGFYGHINTWHEDGEIGAHAFSIKMEPDKLGNYRWMLHQNDTCNEITPKEAQWYVENTSGYATYGDREDMLELAVELREMPPEDSLDGLLAKTEAKESAPQVKEAGLATAASTSKKDEHPARPTKKSEIVSALRPVESQSSGSILAGFRVQNTPFPKVAMASIKTQVGSTHPSAEELLTGVSSR